MKQGQCFHIHVIGIVYCPFKSHDPILIVVSENSFNFSLVRNGFASSVYIEFENALIWRFPFDRDGTFILFGVFLLVTNLYSSALLYTWLIKGGLRFYWKWCHFGCSRFATRGMGWIRPTLGYCPMNLLI